MKKQVSITLLLLSITVLLYAQELSDKTDSDPILNIYIDCNSCDVNYFSENFDLVNIVTEQASADVHILMSEMNMGNGGTASSYVFAGKKRYMSFRDTVTFNIPAETTPAKKRSIQLDKIQLGLVPCIMKTSGASKLFLIIDDSEVIHKIKYDPWKDWIFELGGMGSVYNQKSYSNYNLSLNLSVSKITKKFKIESYNRMNYNETKITYYDYDSTKFQINTFRRGFSSRNLIVKSIGNHFGIGAMGILRNDHINNLSLRLQVGPAIEYNVYPYSEALQKQFRILYSTLYEHTNYVNTTIYDKMEDQGWRQNLSIMARFNDTWGYFDATVSGSNYLNDLSRYSVGATLGASIVIYKGLSVRLYCGMSMYRDRINQARGFATLNEVLTRQREMETDYQYDFSFGITYRFGSKFYPAVNPRFSY